jgi:hypothetical protein
MLCLMLILAVVLAVVLTAVSADRSFRFNESPS